MKKVVCMLVGILVSVSAFSQTKNSSKMERVVFKNGVIEMVGNLYTPEGMETGKKYAAIICSNAAGAVKEQSAGLYAQKLAENGFVALAFDPSFQGESGGKPRYQENPYARVEDIRAAVDYLTTLAFIDTEKIGALGICAGAGYSINAAMTERRIKAVAGVSGTDAGAAIREGWDGKATVAEQIAMLDAVAAQRTAEANGAEPVYGTYVPEKVEEGMAITMVEANDYYRTPRGMHPRSVNKVLMTSLNQIYSFTAYQHIETLLTQPLLMVVGSKSDALYLSQRAVDLATSQKKLYIIDGATHVDLYDVPVYVNQASEILKNFFTMML